MAGRIDKEASCAHAATTSIYCVAAKAIPEGARERAIQQMERQEKVLKADLPRAR